MATVKDPYMITLDFSGNLLIWDYDRIRKVITSTNPMTISTFIGGGASTADGVAPTSVQFTVPGSGAVFGNTKYWNSNLFTLPNGDVYFQSDNYGSTPAAGWRIRHYSASSGLVTSNYVSGTGDSGNPGVNVTSVTLDAFGIMFDPSTSNILSALVFDYDGGTSQYDGINFNVSTWVATPNPNTGRYVSAPWGQTGSTPGGKIVGHDGNLYVLSYSGDTGKYNYATNNWTTLVGNGTVGTCADGTVADLVRLEPQLRIRDGLGPALLCRPRKIRTINSSGQVVTIMGQPFNFGDEEIPSLCSLQLAVNSIDQIGPTAPTNANAIIALDQNSLIFRQFQIGGTISTIAGTGASGGGPYNTAVAATSVPIATLRGKVSITTTSKSIRRRETSITWAARISRSSFKPRENGCLWSEAGRRSTSRPTETWVRRSRSRTERTSLRESSDGTARTCLRCPIPTPGETRTLCLRPTTDRAGRRHLRCGNRDGQRYNLLLDRLERSERDARVGMRGADAQTNISLGPLMIRFRPLLAGQ